MKPKTDKEKFTEKFHLFLEESGFVVFLNRGVKSTMINKIKYDISASIYDLQWTSIEIYSPTRFIRFELWFDYDKMMEPIKVLLNNISFIASEIWKDFPDRNYVSFSANEYFVFYGNGISNKYDIIKMLEF